MIGPDTTKCLTPPELPEPVSLYCHEELPSDEELQPLEAEQTPVEDNIYRVLVKCPRCDRTIRLFCSGSRGSIRGLEQLFLSGLLIICPLCGGNNGRP